MTPTGGPFILYSMWGYAEGNQTLVAVVVILVVGAAIGYLVKRYLDSRGR